MSDVEEQLKDLLLEINITEMFVQCAEFRKPRWQGESSKRSGKASRKFRWSRAAYRDADD